MQPAPGGSAHNASPISAAGNRIIVSKYSNTTFPGGNNAGATAAGGSVRLRLRIPPVAIGGPATVVVEGQDIVYLLGYLS